MKMKITILEDQKIEVKRLQTQLEIWANKTNCLLDTKIYLSGEDYFFHQQHTEETSDVFFLDIQMGTMNGIEVAKRLRAEGFQGYIIFLTAFREYVFHGYEVHALNYLLKPIQPEALFLCLDEIAKDLAGSSYLYRNKQEVVRIPYRDILCFSSNLHYVDILTVSGNYHQHSTLNSIIEYLPKEFIRVHRSHIVNLVHIYKIAGNTIFLSNRMTMQIGRAYIKQVKIAFSDYSVRLDVKGGNL